MSATLIDRQENTLTIQLRIPLTRSLFETEQTILQTLNCAGTLATTEALKQFDTDGSPIQIGQSRYTTKGQEPKTYQTPYGEAIVERHVYQTAQGGPTFCPLERDARIILTATPRFAQQVSHKYAEMAGARVVRDLEANHARQTSLNVIQRLAEVVGSAAQVKEEQWHYATPALEVPVRTISVGLDGTCLLLVDDGHRQAMVGTVSLYDRDGERLHTIYVAATPEYGKESFYQRLGREIEHAQQLYPRAQLTGVADGSSDNWEFLGQYTEDSCVDFYHATAYLQGAARAAHPLQFFGTGAVAGRALLSHSNMACGGRQGNPGRVAGVLVPRVKRESRRRISGQGGVTYFTNQQSRGWIECVGSKRAWPIGSGVTESACKTIVKMRLCRSGAKWKEQGAGIVLSLRTLSYTGRADGEQFWAKIDRYGFPVED